MQKILFIIFGVLFVVMLAWGIISGILLSGVSADRDKFAQSYRNAQERSAAIESRLASTIGKLEESQNIVGRLQSEIDRIRIALGRSETLNRGLVEKLAEFERIAGSIESGTGESESRVAEIARGLEELENAVREMRN